MSPIWRRVGALFLAGGVLATGRSTALVAQAPLELADVAVLSGCWVGRTGSVRLHEQWTEAEGGAMLGTTRYVQDGVLVGWEFGRIVGDSTGVTLWPYPRGVASVRGFPLVRAGSALVFENLEHDFPVRIIYAREVETPEGAERLRVRIEGTDGTGPEWSVERVPCPGAG